MKHSKLSEGGVDTGVNWCDLSSFVAFLPVVVVRKVNVALDEANTNPAHCLSLGMPGSSELDQQWSSSGR